MPTLPTVVAAPPPRPVMMELDDTSFGGEFASDQLIITNAAEKEDDAAATTLFGGTELSSQEEKEIENAVRNIEMNAPIMDFVGAEEEVTATTVASAVAGTSSFLDHYDSKFEFRGTYPNEIVLDFTGQAVDDAAAFAQDVSPIDEPISPLPLSPAQMMIVNEPMNVLLAAAATASGPIGLLNHRPPTYISPYVPTLVDDPSAFPNYNPTPIISTLALPIPRKHMGKGAATKSISSHEPPSHISEPPSFDSDSEEEETEADSGSQTVSRTKKTQESDSESSSSSSSEDDEPLARAEKAPAKKTDHSEEEGEEEEEEEEDEEDNDMSKYISNSKEDDDKSDTDESSSDSDSRSSDEESDEDETDSCESSCDEETLFTCVKEKVKRTKRLVPRNVKSFVNLDSSSKARPKANARRPDNFKAGTCRYIYCPRKCRGERLTFPTVVRVASFAKMKQYYDQQGRDALNSLSAASSKKLTKKQLEAAVLASAVSSPNDVKLKSVSMAYPTKTNSMISLLDISKKLFENKNNYHLRKAFPNGVMIAESEVGHLLRDMSRTVDGIKTHLVFKHEETNRYVETPQDKYEYLNDAPRYSLYYGYVPMCMKNAAYYYMRSTLNNYLKATKEKPDMLRTTAPFYDGEMELYLHSYWELSTQDLIRWDDDSPRKQGKEMLAYLWNELEKSKADDKLALHLANFCYFDKEKSLSTATMWTIKSFFFNILKSCSNDGLKQDWARLLQKYVVHHYMCEHTTAYVHTRIAELPAVLKQKNLEIKASSNNHVTENINSGVPMHLFANLLGTRAPSNIKTLQCKLDTLMYCASKLFAVHIVEQNMVGDLSKNNTRFTLGMLKGCWKKYAGRMLIKNSEAFKMRGFQQRSVKSILSTFQSQVLEELSNNNHKCLTLIKLESRYVAEQFILWILNVIASAVAGPVLNYLEKTQTKTKSEEWCKLLCSAIDSYMERYFHDLNDWKCWSVTDDANLDRKSRGDGKSRDFLSREKRRYDGSDDDYDDASDDEDEEDEDYLPRYLSMKDDLVDAACGIKWKNPEAIYSSDSESDEEQVAGEDIEAEYLRNYKPTQLPEYPQPKPKQSKQLKKSSTSQSSKGKQVKKAVSHTAKSSDESKIEDKKTKLPKIPKLSKRPSAEENSSVSKKKAALNEETRIRSNLKTKANLKFPVVSPLSSRTHCPFCSERDEKDQKRPMIGTQVTIRLRDDIEIACCTFCRSYLEESASSEEIGILCDRIERRCDRAFGFDTDPNNKTVKKFKSNISERRVKISYNRLVAKSKSSSANTSATAKKRKNQEGETAPQKRKYARKSEGGYTKRGDEIPRNVKSKEFVSSSSSDSSDDDDARPRKISKTA